MVFKTRFFGFILVTCILAAAIWIVACKGVFTPKIGPESGLEASINKRLAIILSQKGLSSNPTDYISAHYDVYQSIVKEGKPGFDLLIKKIRDSKEDGLETWIIAKLCTDILKEKNPISEWSSGKDWYRKYLDSIKSK